MKDKDMVKAGVGGMIYDVSTLTEYDIYLFKQGNNFRLYEKLGAHLRSVEGKSGVHFAVWAPNARSVSVIGDFNKWDIGSHFLKMRGDHSGIWEGFLPGLGAGELYKYHIVSNHHNYVVDKGDPFANAWERPPGTSSVVGDLGYQWEDGEWLKERGKKNSLAAPMSVYEVHAGSWRRDAEKPAEFLSYKELGEELAEYCKKMGFTHVELMPIMEHPFYASWGYQTLGYFAPTSRYGKPVEFMAMVDHLHKAGIGVILDWVPSHFPSDEYGLTYFDGTHLFEHADPKEGYHPDWKSYIFNYGRNEVRSFLISSAIFWLDKYHADCLRVDAVASMLYRDYSRKSGEWVPNKFGGRENLEAVEFLRVFNKEVYTSFPDVQTIAEESTSWPMVSRPAYIGGLGFGMKWNMGWMHDSLKYFSQDPINRKYYHGTLTFSIWYAFYENFVLALSHDEVVHGKGSLMGKMAGDEWQKFANLRLLFSYMYAHPGKKLLFMGMELGQWSEWNHDKGLEWGLLEYGQHAGVCKLVGELNRLYKGKPALHELDFEQAGFGWIDINDVDDCVVSFLRKGKNEGEQVVVVCNFTPVVRGNYRVGVPMEGQYEEIFNSDSKDYGGSGVGNGVIMTEAVKCHGFGQSVCLTLPPLGAIYLERKGL